MSTTTTPQYTLERNAEFGFLQIRPTPSAGEIVRSYARESYSSQYPRFNNWALEESSCRTKPSTTRTVKRSARRLGRQARPKTCPGCLSQLRPRSVGSA